MTLLFWNSNLDFHSFSFFLREHMLMSCGAHTEIKGQLAESVISHHHGIELRSSGLVSGPSALTIYTYYSGSLNLSSVFINTQKIMITQVKNGVWKWNSAPLSFLVFWDRLSVTRLVWNPSCRSGWPRIYHSPNILASPVLGLLTSTTIPNSGKIS